MGRDSCGYVDGDVGFAFRDVFIPAYPGAGYEVRGNGEMFPLNGPSWSLFSSISVIFCMLCLFVVCLLRR